MLRFETGPDLTLERSVGEGPRRPELFVNTDTSNARVDTFNRLIQDDLLRRGEIGGAHLDYRSTGAGRHETLYVGDRVALVAVVEDRGRRVANGRKGTIVRLDTEHRRAVVALDGGKAVRVQVAISAPMVPLRLCYAGHACRLQGAEALVVLVVPGDATTSLESAYSSRSRGQEEIHVFADTTTHGPEKAGTPVTAARLAAAAGVPVASQVRCKRDGRGFLSLGMLGDGFDSFGCCGSGVVGW